MPSAAALAAFLPKPSAHADLMDIFFKALLLCSARDKPSSEELVNVARLCRTRLLNASLTTGCGCQTSSGAQWNSWAFSLLRCVSVRGGSFPEDTARLRPSWRQYHLRPWHSRPSVLGCVEHLPQICCRTQTPPVLEPKGPTSPNFE